MSTVVVVGDALLDRDVLGAASRLAPDAPAPVVDVRAERDRPGGAALAAALAADDGHDVCLVTALADDAAGERLRAMLAPRVAVHTLPLAGATPVKARVRVGTQSLLRLDEGNGRAVEPRDARTARAVADAVRVLDDADAVLVADYGRGVTSLSSVREALLATARRHPVVWDPHPQGARPVAGARLVTPNALEARLLSGIDGADDLGTVARRAASLVTAVHATAVAVTRGAAGAVLSFGDPTPFVVPAPPVTCVDPCGAGDRFAAAAAGALAAGALPSEAVVAAVRAASAFVASGGAGAVGAPGSQPGRVGAGLDADTDAFAVVRRVRESGGTVVATGGCFDLLHAGHVTTLQAARRLGDCLVVCVNSDRSVRRLKGAARPIVPEPDRVRVLSALACVDAVAVFDDDTPVPLLRRLRPDVWAKGGDYADDDLPEAEVVRSWGGTVALLPYLTGRSTTGLVAAAADRTDAAAR